MAEEKEKGAEEVEEGGIPKILSTRIKGSLTESVTTIGHFCHMMKRWLYLQPEAMPEMVVVLEQEVAAEVVAQILAEELAEELVEGVVEESPHKKPNQL